MSLGIENMRSQPCQQFNIRDTIHAESATTTTRVPGHNPLLFSTRRNISVPNILRSCFIHRKKPEEDAELGSCLEPVGSACPLKQSYQLSEQPSVHTFAWSDKEPGSGSMVSLNITRKPVACGVQVQTCLSRKS